MLHCFEKRNDNRRCFIDYYYYYYFNHSSPHYLYLYTRPFQKLINGFVIGTEFTGDTADYMWTEIKFDTIFIVVHYDT